MTIADILSLRPWARPEVIGIGREPMRSRAPAYRSVTDALAADPLDRGDVVDLNGTWGFRFFPTPEAAAEWLRGIVGGAAGFDDAAGSDVAAGDWASITVPGNWTLQGWDKPHYTNIRMPFDEIPPSPPRETRPLEPEDSPLDSPCPPPE